MRIWIALLATFSVLAAPLAASAQDAKAKEGAKLLFVTTTGPEDVGMLSSSFRHAEAAAKSDHTSKVVWLGYGRSVVAFDPSVSVLPGSMKEQIVAAQKAGVRIVVCAQALRKWGIDPKTLPEGVEVVANAIDELALLVSDGYEALKY